MFSETPLKDFDVVGLINIKEPLLEWTDQVKVYKLIELKVNKQMLGIPRKSKEEQSLSATSVLGQNFQAS